MNPVHALRPPPCAPTNRLAALGLAALIVLAVWIAYRGTFTVPFVLDDTQAITDNYTIRHFATAWWPPKDTTTTGRPLVNLSLALNYAVGGLDVRGYHAFNLAVHLLAALVLFGVMRRMLRSQHDSPATAPDATFIAGGIALLWAVHPLQTEAVTYTIQRAESLMGLFYLLTLYAFIRGADASSPVKARGWLICSFAACLLGMATKEVMVSAPLIVLLYDRTFVTGTFREALRRRGRYYAGLAATWLGLAALVISTAGRDGTAGLGTKISPLDYALTQCHAIVHYLRLTLWPSPLVFDYGKSVATTVPAAIVPALLLLTLVVGTVFALRTRPLLGFLGAWFFALLAPSSSVVPIATQTIAEHRMYLSLAAIMPLLVLALHRWLGRILTVGAVLFAAVGLTALTTQRNAIYRDALTLWTDTVAKAPDNTRALTNLGLTLLQLGRVAEAQQPFETAVRLQPNEAESHTNYANALLAANRPDAAIGQLEAALRLDPANLEAQNNLGITLAQMGRTGEALAHFEQAIQLKPQSAESHSNLGLALMQVGRTDEALPHFAESARLRPIGPFVHDSYGFALFKAGRLPDAIAELNTALRFDPKLAQAHLHLGLALSRSGRLPEGLAQFEQAAQLAPGEAEIQNQLGLALAAVGRVEEALKHFEQAVALNPDFAEAARNRERARAELSQ